MSTFPNFTNFQAMFYLDESTEACRACLSYVQFNPAKLIKQGLKIFSLCDSKSSDSCYLLQFEPYFGKSHTVVSRHGLYFDVVNRLTKLVRGHNVKLFCDNLYSSLPLFVHLKNQHQILATGTSFKSNWFTTPCQKPWQNDKRGIQDFPRCY